MNVRIFNYDTDYSEVCNWWKHHGWNPLEKTSLSKAGFIVENDNGQKLVAGWVFQTDCDVYILEWIIGNPEADKEERGEAVNALITVASDVAKKLGARTLFTMTKNPSLMDKLQSHNFIKTDEEMIHFVRRLD
jgi:hypothetical protein